MINTHTLARPYAKAAFEFAKSAKLMNPWSTMLNLAAYALKQPVVIQELGKPELARQDKSKFLIDLLTGNIDEAFSRFIEVISEHNRLLLLPTISVLYEHYQLELESIVDVEIETAFKLDEQQLQTLTTALSKRLERAVKAKQIVNNALLGGIVIHAGDLVIDGSARGRLQKLTEALNL